MVYALLQFMTPFVCTATTENAFAAILQLTTFHKLSWLLTFVLCTIAIDKFSMHYCNWQLFYALLQLITVVCHIANVEYSMLQKRRPDHQWQWS